MASIWSRNIENVIKTPALWAFGSVLFAWNAGFQSRVLIYRVRMHNADALARLSRLSGVAAGCVVVELSLSENNSSIERWSLDFTFSRPDQIGTTS
jgi:hypothetical protein